MNTETYDVVLVEMPHHPDAPKLLVEAFGVDATTAQKLLTSLPVVVKRGVALEVAQTYQRAFLEMGAQCHLNRCGLPLPDAPPRSTQPTSSPPPRSLERSSPPPLGASWPRESSPPPSAPSAPKPGPVFTPPPQRRWLVPAVLAGILVVSGGLYWYLRAPRMGGLIIQRAGAEGGGRPAVVLLHGFGAQGDDLVGLGEELAVELPDVQIIVPEGRLGYRGGRVWWKTRLDEARKSRQAVISLIDELIEEGTPADRIVIAGFSQGAILAMDVGLNHVQTLGGVAMLSGGREAQFDWDSLFVDREDLSIFISHGRSDPTLSFRTANRLVTDLRAHDYAVDFVPFQGGHTIPQEVRTGLAEFAAQQF